VERIEQWITNWKKDHGKDGKAETQSSGGKPEDDPMFLHG
jgi:adenylate kinase